jgi:predicted ATPase
VAAALSAVEETGERWYEAELHRLKGEVLLRTGAEAEAEVCLQQSLQVARRQRARFWELRTAASLGRLWQAQGKSDAAHDLIAPVLGWFREGFNTIDLKETGALLEALGRFPGKNTPSPAGGRGLG